jgi:hypothetical protein
MRVKMAFLFFLLLPICLIGVGVGHGASPVFVPTALAPRLESCSLASGGRGVLVTDVLRAIWSDEVCSAAGLLPRDVVPSHVLYGYRRADTKMRDETLFKTIDKKVFLTGHPALEILLKKIHCGE